MKEYVDPFISFLPSIDLHGLDRVSARIKTDEFINDCLKLKKEKIIIIHGKGSGIIKEEVYKYLKNNKNIIDYKLYWNNTGMTIITLNLTK